MKRISRLVDECGQTMTEYAVTLGVITVAIVTAIGITIPGKIAGVINAVRGLFP